MLYNTVKRGGLMFFFFLKNPYVAVIGDIKGSRMLKDRHAVQMKFQDVLSEINEKYSEDIYSKFTITIGDEFQGLLYGGKNLMSIISEIEIAMYPVSFRFGIGVGSISTEVNRDIAIGADGPGYYNARTAIDLLKKNEHRKQAGVSNIRIELADDNQTPQSLINTVFSLMTPIKESWSSKQRQTIYDALLHQDNQSDTARRLGITQPTVQRHLSGGHYYTYKEALDTVQNILDEIGDNNV